MADGATVGLGTARVQEQPGVCGGSSEAKALSPPKGVPDGGDARLRKQDHWPSDPQGARLGGLGAGYSLPCGGPESWGPEGGGDEGHPAPWPPMELPLGWGHIPHFHWDSLCDL